jgi:N-methylhydantoinase A
MSRIDLIVHGTTITTNAVITRRYAKTGYLTTKGFRDILNSRRGLKRNAFTAKESPPPPIVPQSLVRTVDERIDRTGAIIQPLDENDVRAAAAYFRDRDVAAVAIAFMFSFLNDAHEVRAKEILEQEMPDAYITTSSQVLPQVRFYERGSTTVFNACVGPLLRAYIGDLQKTLDDSGFRGRLLTMQSNGGVMSPEVVMAFGANTLLSGPASGPVAAAFFARRHGLGDLITIDMGGTSLDASLVRDGRAAVTDRTEVAEYALALPSLDINAIGAGGGSIAAVDEGGILSVGPQSAGAVPGPAAYGFGGDRPTVTDANLVLGYLNPDYFLGGQRRLDTALATKAIERHVARPLGVEVKEAASGIVQLIGAQMANGVRQVSIVRGVDPRDSTLVAAGGAGGLHACAIADDLELDLILIPRTASVLCATGMLATSLRHDLTHFASIRVDAKGAARALAGLRRDLLVRGGKILSEERIPKRRQRFEFSCNMQFEGQFNTLETRLPVLDSKAPTTPTMATIRDAFVAHHDRVYGYTLADSAVEIQSIRLTAIGVSRKPEFGAIRRGKRAPDGARKGARQAWFKGRMRRVPIYEGTELRAGNEIVGPALIEEPTTTVRIDDGWSLFTDPIGSYLLWRTGADRRKIVARLARGGQSAEAA